MKLFPRTPIIVAFVVILFNLVLAYAQTNGTNTLPTVPTETTESWSVGLIAAISTAVAAVVALITYLKKKKPPTT